MVVRTPAAGTARAGRTSTIGQRGSTAASGRWPAGRADPTDTTTSIQKRYCLNPHSQHAPPEPPSGHRRTVGEAAKPRLNALRGKPVAGAAPRGIGGEGKAQEKVHAQALRADAASWPANPDRCEGRTATLHRRSAAEAIRFLCLCHFCKVHAQGCER